MLTLSANTANLVNYERLRIDIPLRNKLNHLNFIIYLVSNTVNEGCRYGQFNQFEPYQASFNPITSLLSNEADLYQQVINNYDNGTLQADFFITQIFAQLEQQGILQNSIVYVTADHGEGFGEHGHYGHTRFLYEEHTSLPLFIYDPLGS